MELLVTKSSSNLDHPNCPGPLVIWYFLLLQKFLRVPVSSCVIFSASAGRIHHFQDNRPRPALVRLPRQYVVSLILDECAFFFLVSFPANVCEWRFAFFSGERRFSYSNAGMRLGFQVRFTHVVWPSASCFTSERFCFASVEQDSSSQESCGNKTSDRLALWLLQISYRVGNLIREIKKQKLVGP